MYKYINYLYIFFILKTNKMQDNLLDYIKAISKKEHHIHLDGSVFPYILSQITDKNTQEYIESLYIKDINQSVDSLANFLNLSKK